MNNSLNPDNYIPANFSLLYSKEQIAQEISRLGSEIHPWITQAESETNAPVICLCVLRGATFFFADLVREIPHNVHLEFCQIKSYSVEENTPLAETDINPIELPTSLKGRAVLIIDDICDQGRLLKTLHARVSASEAQSFKTAVMIYKEIPESQYTPDYYSFKLNNDKWLVGMGLDDKNSYRNIPAIYEMK